MWLPHFSKTLPAEECMWLPHFSKTLKAGEVSCQRKEKVAKSWPKGGSNT